MKIKIRYKDHRETARILELASDSSTLVPMHGDDVFLDGSLFSVQNRTFDYDNHTCTVTIVRDGRTTEHIRRQQEETTPKRRSPSGFTDWFMCGCYYRKSDKQKIAEAFHATKVDDFPLPSWDYNVAPTSMQPSIRDTGERDLVSLRWGDLASSNGMSSYCLFLESANWLVMNALHPKENGSVLAERWGRQTEDTAPEARGGELNGRWV